ncbi:hypothetical protein [Hymenobacter jeollabukensis]|uniref:Uncharacterized protein n=1 Tax=Hymenobacter jeollabukensis TaxID=2025313 RepID=A0A5R8WY47_9BACT|nr:hypothetical protein [Hymenobacter jeollabukensis]TLM97065.1 hypothetical protein FDY95_03480 [Hymenobacter jeollabukensis]
MDILFDLNLDHTYAEHLRQQNPDSLAAQELITDLEDKIGAAVNLVWQRHRTLPAVGDRVEVDSEWVLITARTFGQDGSVWLAAGRVEA